MIFFCLLLQVLLKFHLHDAQFVVRLIAILGLEEVQLPGSGGGYLDNLSELIALLTRALQANRNPIRHDGFYREVNVA